MLAGMCDGQENWLWQLSVSSLWLCLCVCVCVFGWLPGCNEWDVLLTVQHFLCFSLSLSPPAVGCLEVERSCSPLCSTKPRGPTTDRPQESHVCSWPSRWKTFSEVLPVHRVHFSKAKFAQYSTSTRNQGACDRWGCTVAHLAHSFCSCLMGFWKNFLKYDLDSLNADQIS